MDKINELEYEIKQLKFEKENLKRQLVAAMRVNKKNFENEVELKKIIEVLRKNLNNK